jgi:hypothetical protein
MPLQGIPTSLENFEVRELDGPPPTPTVQDAAVREGVPGLSVSAPATHLQACMEELLEFTRAGNELTMEALIEIQGRHGVRNVSDEDQWYDMKGQ